MRNYEPLPEITDEEVELQAKMYRMNPAQLRAILEARRAERLALRDVGRAKQGGGP